jgi:hypothetical protein
MLTRLGDPFLTMETEAVSTRPRWGTSGHETPAYRADSLRGERTRASSRFRAGVRVVFATAQTWEPHCQGLRLAACAQATGRPCLRGSMVSLVCDLAVQVQPALEFDHGNDSLASNLD